MNVLKKLQNAKAYRGFVNLENGYHQILSFRVVKNKFFKKNEGTAKSIVVELSNEVLFLPQHFMQKLDEEDIQESESSN
jgi:hypothetical protein